MGRAAALVLVALIVGACAPTTPVAPTLSAAQPSQATAAAAGTPAPSASTAASAAPAPSRTAAPTEPASPGPDTEPVTGDDDWTEYERELATYLREDARVDCAPRRADLPADATAQWSATSAAGSWIGSPCTASSSRARLDAGEEGFNERAVVAYLDRMDREGVLGRSGDCADGTPHDASWSGPEADEPGSTVYAQVEIDGRHYSTHRYGCFLNDQGIANVRATCGQGSYIGVLGQDARLAALTEWTMRWPNPDDLSFPSPGICAGQHQDTP